MALEGACSSSLGVCESVWATGWDVCVREDVTKGGAVFHKRVRDGGRVFLSKLASWVFVD